jgi:hypothetical protein
MSANKGFLGGVFDDCAVLWFIILFLLLFWHNGCGTSDFSHREAPLEPELTIE